MLCSSLHTSHVVVRASLVGLALGFMPALVQADVRILNQPGSNYTTIQAAVDAASEKDTLLISGGAHGGFTIDAKGLTLLSAPGVQGEVQGTVVVRNLALGSTVHMDGLVLRGVVAPYTIPEPALRLESNLGGFRAYDCDIQGGTVPLSHFTKNWEDGGDAVYVTGSSNVAFLSSQLVGGAGGGDFGTFVGVGGIGGNGLSSINSAIALYHCFVAGGIGGRAGTQGGDGGDGCNISGIGMFVSGTTFMGGDGGVADDVVAWKGGDGGTGLWVAANTNVRLLDNIYLGGVGGNAIAGTNGAPGAPNYWEGGVLNETPGVRRGLEVITSVIQDGDDFHLVASGLPGDRVFLAMGQKSIFRFTTDPPGVRLVPFPRFLPWNGGTLIGPSGVADIFLSSRDLQGGDWNSLMVQAIVRPAGGGKAIGGMAFLTSLDNEVGPDCNSNGQLDLFDVASGLEADCNGDFVPDSCFAVTDCNGNGVDDSIDLDCGFSEDSNNNGIPDECEFGALYVDVNAVAPGNGSQATPFVDLASAFAVAQSETTILIAPGTYVGPANRDLDFLGRDLELIGMAGPNATVLDLQQNGTAFLVDGQPSVAKITNLTVKNAGTGGARVTLGAVATFTNCVFKDCEATGAGGAILNMGKTTLMDCLFIGNSATGADSTGGAVHNTRDMDIIRTTFNGNSADSGGAFSHSHSQINLNLLLCVFRSNTAQTRGGAGFGSKGTVVVSNCYFSQNSVTGGGGGALWVGTDDAVPATLVLESSTLVNNHAGNGTGQFEGGGACFVARGGKGYIRNSIFWYNTGASGSQFKLNTTLQIDIDFSDMQGGIGAVAVVDGAVIAGANLIDLDPLFENPAIGDYRLGGGSPCVDAGRDLSLPQDEFDLNADGNLLDFLSYDLLNAPREQDDLNVADTGEGVIPITDMGCLER